MNQATVDVRIREAARLLENAGVEDAFGNARQLMAAALGATGPNYLHAYERPMTEVESDRFNGLVQRRAAREPLQHIVGKTGFLNIEIKTDRRALIPRDDTETLVLLVCRMLRLDPFADMKSDRVLKIADLGTGSGVILAAMLHELPQSHGIAVEQNVEALGLAKENFEALGMIDRIDLFHGSWSDWTDWSNCDLILSNPPYICSDVIPDLAPEVCEYDPLEALDGGVDGLQAYREIITLAGAKMKPGAHLALEIGFDQKSSVSDLLIAAGFADLQHLQDLGSHDRAVAAKKT